jgi:hypothetical protein
MKAITLSLLFICGLTYSVLGQQLVVNGSLNPSNPAVNTGTENGVLPTSWLATNSLFGASTPDTFDAASTFQGYAFAPLAGGDYFTHAQTTVNSLNPSLIYQEGIRQTITGATIGQTYLLEFDQAIDRQASGSPINPLEGTFGYFSISVSNTGFTSSRMLLPNSSGIQVPWTHQSFTFVAASETFELAFRAGIIPDFRPNPLPGFPNSNERRVDLGLDNVSITAVPEPGSVVLLAALGVAVTLRRMRFRW